MTQALHPTRFAGEGPDRPSGPACGEVPCMALCRRPIDKSRRRAPQGKELARPRQRSCSTNGDSGNRSREVGLVLRREQVSFNPAEVFVIVDGAEDSIDDGHFLVWPSSDTRWVNLPAGRHNQSGVLSFADGHVEHWKWKAAKHFSVKQRYWSVAANADDLRDLRRLQALTIPVTDFLPQGVSEQQPLHRAARGLGDAK